MASIESRPKLAISTPPCLIVSNAASVIVHERANTTQQISGGAMTIRDTRLLYASDSTFFQLRARGSVITVPLLCNRLLRVPVWLCALLLVEDIVEKCISTSTDLHCHYTM